jgi:hypothetical protein
MTHSAITPFTLALLLLQSAGVAPPQDGDASAQQAIVKLENHWLAVENEPAALDDILADDFLHVLPQGIVTKREQLDFMRAHPAPKDGTTRRFEDLRVRVYGTAAVATGVVVAATHNGKTQKTAFTDVFALRAGRWRAVNAQETSLP